MSSDRPPRDIATLEERLRSRFEWGLITDIQPPDLETRIAILRKKVKTDGIHIPDTQVLTFIASRVSTNIRELEGALTRVVAFSSLTGRAMSVELAQDVLKDVFPQGEAAEVSIKRIQDLVAERFNLSLEELCGDAAEALLGVGDQEVVLRRAVRRPRPAVHRLPDALGRSLGAVDDRDPLADHLLDRCAQDRVVSASEHERIDRGVHEGPEVDFGNLARNMRVGPSLFGERHEQRGSGLNDLDIALHTSDRGGVRARSHRSLGCQNADRSAPAPLDRCARARLDHADHRNRELFAKRRQRCRRGGVAGDDQHLDATPEKMVRCLQRIPRHDGGRFRPVRNARGVAEVDQRLIGKRPRNLPEDRQSAHSGVEHSDGPRIVMRPWHGAAKVLRTCHRPG